MFPALGTSARLATLPVSLLPPFTVTTLSTYDWAAARGQMSPTWDSASPFVIAEPHDVCVWEKKKESERERNRARKGI